MKVFKNGILCGIDKNHCQTKDCKNCNLAQLTKEEVEAMGERAGDK